MKALGNVVNARTLVLTILLSTGPPAFAQAAGQLRPYVAESKLYALYKPADWTVKEQPQAASFRLLVQSPDGASTVDFYWARNEQGKPDCLRPLAMFRGILGRTYPDVSFSEVYLSRDAAHAVATVRWHAGPTVVKGRYYFEANSKGISVQGYAAPETRLLSQRSLLLNMMASLAFSQADGAPGRPQFVQLPLIPRQAQDGSLSLKTPADWNFLAGGGKVIAGAPDGGMGFIFTSIQGNPIVRGATIAQGVISSPYRPPSQGLTLILQAFGHRDVRILSASPDPVTNQQFLAYVHRRCDAQDIVARWTSSRGANCVGAIKVINALPSVTGLWFCIMAGAWGPEKDFYRYYPMLEQIGDSFSINDQFARRYIQAGLENLRRLQQQTIAAMQDLNRAREQNQADWEARQARKDFMESKWDDYRRGNSYWISDLEGGKVYQTDSWGTRDTLTGDYYEGRPYNWVNFEGQNPRYPSENMREVSSYELEQIMGRRR